MRSVRSFTSTTVVLAFLAVACGSAPSPSPSTSSGPPAATASAAPSSTPGSSLPAVAPTPARAASATLPVHGHAREVGEGVRMAPGQDGTLYVSIPKSDGSVLTLLDRGGRPLPGWPIKIPGATSCGLLLPVEDGSVRVVCTLENPGNLFDPIAAFAFDSTGGPLAGWPVELADFYLAGRMVGDDLVLAMTWSLGDVIAEGQPSTEGGLVVVAADGTLTNGVRLPDPWACCADGPVIGPDGVAYFVGVEQGAEVGSDEVNRITALDLSGVRAGWPITFEGTGSRPAFGPDGQIAVTVSSYVRGTTRVLTFDPDGTAAPSSSAELSLQTSSYAETGGCQPSQPQAPLVDGNGRIFVWSEMDDRILALDPSLTVRGGWPYRTATTLVRPDSRYVKEDAFCPGLTAPTVGPDETLYLSLQAPAATVGGSLVAVDPVGRELAGWPVGLRRPGSEFWSVVVGADGTVYAIAVELESSRTSSASVLAIAPDSSVLYTTTIIDP